MNLLGIRLEVLVVLCASILSVQTKAQAHSHVPFPAPQFDLSPYLKSTADSFNSEFKESNWQPELTGFQWVVPSQGISSDVEILRSNNNVAITKFQGRLWLAFRTSKTHFAGKKTQMHVLSSSDGLNWNIEYTVKLGRDVREPQLIEINQELHFFFFIGGKNMFSFDPAQIQHVKRTENGDWIPNLTVESGTEVPWEFKNRLGKSLVSTYSGPHYRLTGQSNVSVHFRETKDGETFTDVSPERHAVYRGGVSEVGWEFDSKGDLWAVGRNEDGDSMGFGSTLFHSENGGASPWKVMNTDPDCYMSPKMFRHGEEIYLVGRKQRGNHPFERAPEWFSPFFKRAINWVSFSLSPKATGLYRINRKTHQIEWVMDLPGTGDTAFPSIVQIAEHEFVIANYSSPLRAKRRTWLRGQLGNTGIYLSRITFKPKP